jgi:hypothetical protein
MTSSISSSGDVDERGLHLEVSIPFGAVGEVSAYADSPAMTGPSSKLTRTFFFLLRVDLEPSSDTASDVSLGGPLLAMTTGE